MGWAGSLVSKAPVKKVRYYTDEEWVQINKEAAELYRSRDLVAPKWEQLGEGTQSVWQKMVLKEAHWQ